VIGYTLRNGALLRWLMTRHITGEYAEAFDDLCNSSSKDKLHDELGDTRIQRDKKDVKDTTEYLLSQCQDLFNHDDVPLKSCQHHYKPSCLVKNSLRNIPEKGKTVVPPALFNDDGRMRKTYKADIAQKLSSLIVRTL